FNRFADRALDRENPRTAIRAIPAGRLSPPVALGWTVFSALLFIAAAWALNPLAGWCSFPVLMILGFYSFWKRFSWATHWYLGLCLGLAPMAVCVALKSTIPFGAVILGI